MTPAPTPPGSTNGSGSTAIGCRATVEVFFSGDDLFAPFERRRGLPIGNLTSQFFPQIASWCAHAIHGHAHRLRESLFRGWPPGEPPKPEGSNRPAAPCAAVRGTTIPGTSARRSTTGTGPTTATTTSASVSPVHSRQGWAATFKDAAGAPGSVQGLNERKPPPGVGFRGRRRGRDLKEEFHESRRSPD